MFSKFGRQIFKLYETRPLLMNSIVGGSVYVAGEYTVQTQSKDARFFTWENYSKLGQLGALGAAENGLVMMKWYGFLNRFIGSSVSTNTVLLKCLLDQLFFATQQDLLFLGLCAYNDTVDTADAVQEVKDTFLTTWIVDCSLWPVVNFVGFAFIPVVLQPTYMAFVSYFWQLYMSSAASKEIHETCDAELEALFKELDTDSSGYIDAMELQTYFKQRGITVTQAEVRQMIADADLVGRGIQVEEGTPDEQVCDDGQVSLDEFKRLATHGDQLHLKTSALWASVRQDISLSYGSKHAMKRLETLKAAQTTKGANSSSSAAQLPALIAAVVPVPPPHQGSKEVVSSGSTGTATAGNPHTLTESIKHTITTPVPVHPPVHHPPVDTTDSTKNGATIPTSTSTTTTAGAAPTTDNADAKSDEEVERERIAAMRENRSAAIDKASAGGAILAVAVLVRKLVFKL